MAPSFRYLLGAVCGALVADAVRPSQDDSVEGVHGHEDEARGGDPKDPRVVKDALRTVYEYILAHESHPPSGSTDIPLRNSVDKCFVSTQMDINGPLAEVRSQWKAQFPGDFMDAASPADALLGKFSKLQRQTEGSRSGSAIYVSDSKQLFLKSEGSNELKVFSKKRPRGDRRKVFITDYVQRVTGADVAADQRACMHSTLMRFLVVFTVRCESRWSRGTPAVWMLFTNVSPLKTVPKPLHMFDLKASRDIDDCHGKAWTAKNGKQGMLGDFLSLYKDPVEETECTERKLNFLNTSRKVCFMKALHWDLRTLGRFNLIDYSFYVTVHNYNEATDGEQLHKFNNVLPVNINGEDKVMTIGTIDLLKDFDASYGIQFQNWMGLTKGGGFTETIFGQRKFDSYPYYLFCLAVDVMDPVCEGARSLQLLSTCDKGDDPRISFPGGKKTTTAETTQMGRYLESNNYCQLVNSCNALVHTPDAGKELSVCQEHTCKIFGLKRCMNGVHQDSGEVDYGVWDFLKLVNPRSAHRTSPSARQAPSSRTSHSSHV